VAARHKLPCKENLGAGAVAFTMSIFKRDNGQARVRQKVEQQIKGKKVLGKEDSSGN